MTLLPVEKMSSKVQSLESILDLYHTSNPHGYVSLSNNIQGTDIKAQITKLRKTTEKDVLDCD